MDFYTPITNHQREKLRKRCPATYNYIKKKKIPRNKFTKEIKDLYLENYKTLKREIEEYTIKWKDMNKQNRNKFRNTENKLMVVR